METVYCSVGSIVLYYYPYCSPKDPRKLKEGKEAEKIAKKKTKYTYYQRKLRARIIYDDMIVELIGVVDFLLIHKYRYVIKEKKNYWFNHPRIMDRIRLQLSLYAFLLSENYNVEYKDIELVALDKTNNGERIDPIPRKRLLEMIHKYAKVRKMMESFVIKI